MAIGMLKVCRLLKWDCEPGCECDEPMLPLDVGGVLFATEFSEVVTYPASELGDASPRDPR